MPIRLVKGAYWDAETFESDAHSVEAPQFLNKEETDLHFRQLIIRSFEASPHEKSRQPFNPRRATRGRKAKKRRKGLGQGEAEARGGEAQGRGAGRGHEEAQRAPLPAARGARRLWCPLAQNRSMHRLPAVRAAQIERRRARSIRAPRPPAGRLQSALRPPMRLRCIF